MDRAVLRLHLCVNHELGAFEVHGRGRYPRCSEEQSPVFGICLLDPYDAND